MKDLKARLLQCNLQNPQVRELMRGHILAEKERLGETREALGGCLDAATILIDSAGQVEDDETVEIQNLLLQLMDVVAGARARRTPEPPAPESAPSTGINLLNHMALGQVMVQLGHVSSEVVDRALVEATRNQMPIGQVLLRMNAISKEDLEQACSLQRVLTIHGSQDGDQTFPSHAVHRVLLGETLVSNGLIDRVQLEQGLELHRRGGLRLGEALIELGHLQPDALQRAIKLKG